MSWTPSHDVNFFKESTVHLVKIAAGADVPVLLTVAVKALGGARVHRSS